MVCIKCPIATINFLIKNVSVPLLKKPLTTELTSVLDAPTQKVKQCVHPPCSVFSLFSFTLLTSPSLPLTLRALQVSVDLWATVLSLSITISPTCRFLFVECQCCLVMILWRYYHFQRLQNCCFAPYRSSPGNEPGGGSAVLDFMWSRWLWVSGSRLSRLFKLSTVRGWLWPWLCKVQSVVNRRWVCHGQVTEWCSEHFWQSLFGAPTCHLYDSSGTYSWKNHNVFLTETHWVSALHLFQSCHEFILCPNKVGVLVTMDLMNCTSNSNETSQAVDKSIRGKI